MMILMLKRMMLLVSVLALGSVVVAVALTLRVIPVVQPPKTPAEFAPLRIADTINRVTTLGRGWINDLDWSGDTLAVATSVGV